MTDATRTLIESATHGDAVAIDTLLARFLPELHAFIRLNMGAILNAKESSSDLAQSVCREVLQDLGAFEYRGDLAFRRWLFLTAQRKIASRGRYWKRQQRDARREQEPLTDDLLKSAASLVTPSRVVVGREEHARLWKAMEALTEDQRCILLMARGLGMTPTEIAAEVGKTANAVRVTLHRALARLAVIQDQLEHGTDPDGGG